MIWCDLVIGDFSGSGDLPVLVIWRGLKLRCTPFVSTLRPKACPLNGWPETCASDLSHPQLPEARHQESSQSTSCLQFPEPAPHPSAVAKKLTQVHTSIEGSRYRPNEPDRSGVLFPENAVVCLMTLMSNGDTIEAATVGREGVLDSRRASAHLKHAVRKPSWLSKARP